ncbi:estrogen-related receptor gamma [Caerostris extrusa]|uniref:Estrogen-related receptor gamma n=1 Tax=Caerostris extrusa TaxID=172846 RepID=A0AAV4MK15_CAEEX|nr:estrogen-related receptor gamma [Caerostris extrusa]
MKPLNSKLRSVKVIVIALLRKCLDIFRLQMAFPYEMNGLMATHSGVIVQQVKTEDPSDVSSGSLCPSSPHLYSPSNSGISNSQTDFSRIMGPVVGSSKSHCQSSEQLTMEIYPGIADQSPSSPGSPESRHQDMFCSSTMSGDGIGAVVVSNSEGKSGDSPKRYCLVCGDVASGFHYGVASCEACKAFFKRTIQGNIEYTCPANNDCEINKRRRKACQACRFQKCLKMGMLKEGVRLDRVRGGRQKYRRCQESPYQVHPVTCKKPSIEDNKIITALVNCEPEPVIISPNPSLPESEFKMISTLSELVDRELVSIIGWAKQIPGFTDLTLNDQMKLLQTTWAEILSLSLAYRSYTTGSEPFKLYFTQEFTMDERQAQDCQATELFSRSVRLVKRLDSISIAKEEYLALKALLLANADIQLEDSVSVHKLRDTIFNGLQNCVTVYRTTNCVEHLGQLMMCLPLLRQLDAEVRLFWSGIRKAGKVALNKLFIEMLESNGPPLL